jgi:hypothetical protein
MEELKDFKSVMCMLSSIPNINSGGCAISAIAMLLWLKRHNPSTDVNVVYLYDCKRDYNINNKFINGKSSDVRACSHAVLYVDGNYIDCNGTVNVLNYGYKHTFDTVSLAVNTLKALNWNPMFDRNSYLPIIEERLDIDIFSYETTENLTKTEYKLFGFIKKYLYIVFQIDKK